MNNQNDILDIVFAGKNKAYGAYQLRHAYPSHVRRAILYGILALGLLFIIPLLPDRAIEQLPPVPGLPGIELTTDVFLPAEPASSEPVQRQQPQVKDVTPIVRPDASVPVDQPLVPVDQLVTSPTTGTTDGVAYSGNTGIVDSPAGTGDAPVDNASLNATPVKDPVIHDYVAQMPEFPGGELALRKYLAKNTVYPRLDKEIGIQGKVIIRFVVDENGKVGNVEIIRGLSKTINDEAKRVISSMPLWKPGRQNDRNVKVYYTVPVVFKLE